MRVCLTSSHWLLRWKWKYSNQSCNYDCWSCGFSKIESVILGDLMMHIIYFKILLQGHWLSCGAFFMGLSIMRCGGVCHGWRRAGILSQLHNICSQMKTAWDFDSESSHFAKAHKHLLKNIWEKNFFSESRSFSHLSATWANDDFSICRFVKHHGMFWFSIKNILPKWFWSPVLENKRVSSLSPSSMCSNIQ